MWSKEKQLCLVEAYPDIAAAKDQVTEQTDNGKFTPVHVVFSDFVNCSMIRLEKELCTRLHKQKPSKVIVKQTSAPMEKSVYLKN